MQTLVKVELFKLKYSWSRAIVESVENHFYFIIVTGNFVSAPIACDIRFLNIIVKAIHFYE